MTGPGEERGSEPRLRRAAAAGGDDSGPPVSPAGAMSDDERAHAAAADALARMRRDAQDQGLRPGGPVKPRTKKRRKARGDAWGGRGRDPELLGDEIDRLLVTRGWEADVQVGSVMGRWAEIVGPDIAAHTKPEGFEGSTLVVKADSTAWAAQLRLLTGALLGKIAAVVGHGVVEDLQIQGPAAPSWRHGSRHVKGPGPRDTYG